MSEKTRSQERKFLGFSFTAGPELCSAARPLQISTHWDKLDDRDEQTTAQRFMSLRLGQPAPTLFEVPADYEEVPPSAAALTRFRGCDRCKAGSTTGDAGILAQNALMDKRYGQQAAERAEKMPLIT